MNKYNQIVLGISATAFLLGCSSVAAVRQLEASDLLAQYEPNAKQPFGVRNPTAPAEISQYEFMIGEWSCAERFRQQDGSWKNVQSLVRGNYFLNGQGVANHTFLPNEASLMTYQYNPDAGNWWIINSKAPGFSSTQWLGVKDGSNMVATLKQTTATDNPRSLKITFQNIQSDSFEWKLELGTPGGPIVVRDKFCQRTK